MNNHLEDSNLFYVFSKNMATSVNFITGKTFHRRNNDDGKPVYTFINCQEVRDAIGDLTELKNKYRK